MSQSGNPKDALVEAVDRDDHVFNIKADNVNVSGFTIMGGMENTTMWKSGICIDGASNCIISNNIVSNNGNGIYLLYPANNNILINNTANSNEYNGILVSFSSDNNKLNGNSALDNPSGISIRGSNNTVEHNNASKNDIGIGIYGEDNALADNVVTMNGNRGIVISGSDNKLFNNFISSNVGEYGFGIFISSFSCYNTLLNNTIESNNCNLYIEERAENNTLKENSISRELLGYDGIIERSMKRIEEEMENESSSMDHDSIDRKPLEFGPDTFEELKNETNVIATYGKMPSFENETQRRDWLGILLEIGYGARNETESYFHPNGLVIITGCSINGCLEVGILEGTEINDSNLDEIYHIFDRQAEEIGVDEVPVVFQYEGFVVEDIGYEEEIVEESTTNPAENDSEQQSEVMPGLRILTSFIGLIAAFMFVKRGIQ